MPQPLLPASQKEKESTSPSIRACDMCRQKKIRCNVVSEVCAQCIKYKTPCHFTPISKKRAPRRSRRDKHVEELEKRLKSTEELVKCLVSNQPSDGEFGRGSGSLKTPPISDQSRSMSSDSGSDMDSSPKITSEQSRGSNFSAPPSETSSSSEVSGNRKLLPRAPNSDISTARAIKTLPPKDRVLSMVEQSFQGFHPAYPLFDKARFMSTFDSLETSMNDPGWLACLNVILALQSQFQHGTVRDDKEDYESWRYFQAAFALAGQLMTMHVTIRSVQALLGMAIVIQGTPDQGPVSLLISAAMKLAHRMGLHRRCQDPNISAAELAERKQVFWIAYSIDKDLSLRMGQPSAQDDEDMDVELPHESDGSLTYPTDLTGMNFINFRARLAMIQGQIYKRLCSVKATKQPVADRALAATELESMLQLWRASVPSDFIDDGYGSYLTVPSQRPITLQLLYFNSLAIIYNSLPAQPRYREIQDKSDPIEFQLLATPPTYAAEARKAITLLQITPRRRYACIWAVLYVFVKAATTLLENIVCDPWSPMALSDLKLIEPLLTLLGVLAKTSKGRNSDRITGMHRSCLHLFQQAKIAIEGTYLANLDWDQCMLGGPSQEQEMTDDFIWGMDNINAEHDVELSSITPGVSQDFAFAVEHQFQESMMST